MTDAPPGRRAPWRAAARGFVVGLGIGLLVGAVGQAAAFALFVAEGANGSYLPYLGIGAVYVELFHHVGVELRALPAGGGSPLSIAIGIGLLSVLAVAVALLSAAGRRVAPMSAGIVAATVPAVAVGYAIVPFGLSFVADARTSGAVVGAASIEIGASKWAALLVPFAAACVAVTIGALSSPAGPATASHTGSSAVASTGTSADALIADAVRGGVRAFALGLLLSAAGFLVLASVQPAVVDAYSAVIGAPDSVQGRIVVGGHAVLMLPNQAIWVLVPALGACDDIVVDGRTTPVLCYSRMPTGLSADFTADATPVGVRPAFRRPPRGYLAFLLAPLVATIAGGVRAARRAGSARTAVVAGATSGVLFAGLVAAGIALARIDLRATGSLLGGSVVRVEFGPELLRGTLLAALWGVAGGAVGGLASRFVGRGPRYVGGAGAITE